LLDNSSRPPWRANERANDYPLCVGKQWPPPDPSEHAMNYTRHSLKIPDNRYRSPERKRFRRMILQRDRYRCVKCGADVSRPGSATVDHITPISRGGSFYDPSNVRTLCTSRAKGGNGCDNQAHREKGRAGTTPAAGNRDELIVIQGCDEDGTPKDKRHPWNQR
jgi:5-methylcytosine-specific restriction endonuclease McrA